MGFMAREIEGGMMVQDIIMAACSLFFMIGLLPQVIHGFRTRSGDVVVSTCVITTVALCVFSICLLTLGCIFSGVIELIVGALWLVMLFQRLIYGGAEDGR